MKVHLLAAWANPGPGSFVWHLHQYVAHRRASAMLVERSLGRCAAMVTNSASVAADVREALGGRVPIHEPADAERARP